jgi:hypothetical protein
MNTVDPRAVVLVGCSARKSGVAGTPRDFYTGDLFRASVEWAESWGLRWAALSAGVAPGPYDEGHPARPDLGLTLVRMYEGLATAVDDALTVAADKSAADALDYLCDFLNARDAASETGIAAYDRWAARGRP